MELLKEKETIYQLMKELITERRELTKQYYFLKERLKSLDTSQELNHSNEQVLFSRNNQSNSMKQEIEYQKYKLTSKKNTTIPYDKISIIICSLLKESGTPLNTKQIYHILTQNYSFNLSYQNLTNNILPRTAKDQSLNIEKAYRGFYQYRQK
ncbi:TPA: hypothetical protein ACHJYD_001987 [Enterococcus faecalis]